MAAMSRFAYSPPRVDSSKGPHRVNRAHWPTKENIAKYYHFCWSHGPLFWTPRHFFFLSHGPLFWTPRQNSFGVMGLFFGPLDKTFLESWFPDFQTPLPADELSDPNLTPLPTHPGIKYVARALAATFHIMETFSVTNDQK